MPTEENQEEEIALPKFSFRRSQAKEEAPDTDIYIWTKIPLPINADAHEISHFVASNNKKNLYLILRSTDTEKNGIYFSEDLGKNWMKFGFKENTILRAKPSKALKGFGAIGNPTELRWNSKVDECEMLLATEDGTVIVDKNKILIIKDDAVVWGIDTALHYRRGQFSRDPYNHVDDIAKNEKIIFAKVLPTIFGSTLVFGLESPNMVFLKDAAGALSRTSAPRRLLTKLAPDKDLNEVWLMAGTTFSGDLLLASENGVWEFPNKGISAWNEQLMALSPDERGVLAPVNNGSDIHWTNTNNKIKLIGSFNDNGINHYFVGLEALGNENTGGLAHFKGVQPEGLPAPLSFQTMSIYDQNINGGLRFLTDRGLKGVSPKGMPDKNADISFARIAREKQEMTTDKDAVDFSSLDGKKFMLFGDEQRSLFWLSTGIFVREKTRGKIRK